ncbi:MAG: hypothetical protein U9N09_09245 [Euryarchaeota archaeon]|nr:hypothetical protein [Euryarchaeota archaeon]
MVTIVVGVQTSSSWCDQSWRLDATAICPLEYDDSADWCMKEGFSGVDDAAQLTTNSRPPPCCLCRSLCHRIRKPKTSVT